MKSHFALCAGLIAVCMLSACGKVVTKAGSHEKLIQDGQNIVDSEYLIGPGDEIEIKFFFTPELNDRVTVRPDGKISLMFADEVDAEGKTTNELSDIIRKKLAPHVKQLDLSVVVREFGSQRVFVGGEVERPGAFTLTGRQTLLQVLDEAGWIKPEGQMGEVVLIRRNSDGVEEVYPLNLSRVMSGEDTSQNVYLMANDTILVPPYGGVDTSRWVERNVKGVNPFTLGFTINRGVGPN